MFSVYVFVEEGDSTMLQYAYMTQRVFIMETVLLSVPVVRYEEAQILDDVESMIRAPFPLIHTHFTFQQHS